MKFWKDKKKEKRKRLKLLGIENNNAIGEDKECF
jgi:hypothetical protein